MVQRVRLNFITGGILITSIGCSIFAILFLLSPELTANPQAITIVFSFLILFIELGLFITRKGIKMRDNVIRTSNYGFWTKLAKYILLYETISLIIGFLLFGTMLGIFFIKALKISLPQIHNPNTYRIIFVLVPYVMLRIPIILVLSFIKRLITVWYQNNFIFQYSVCNDGFEIIPSKFQFIGLKFKLLIRFSEIIELRDMDWYEAEAYKKNLGINLPLAINQTKDLYTLGKFGKRPKVFFHTSNLGRTLLIKGKNLHYLVTLGKGDLNDLIKAFDHYKKR